MATIWTHILAQRMSHVMPGRQDSGRRQSECDDLHFLLLEVETNIVKTSLADGCLASRIAEQTRLAAR